MSRHNLTFKRTCNALLASIQDTAPGEDLGPESALCLATGASRTTVRHALTRLSELGVIAWDGREKRMLRLPHAGDFFALDAENSPTDRAEAAFLEWILRGDLPPGTRFNESSLARQLDIPVATLRALLTRVQAIGLISKEPNRYWVLRGFTRDFATEMFDMRELIEMTAIQHMAAAASESDAMREMADLEQTHRELLAKPDPTMAAFSALDARFHKVICAAANNRFFDQFAQQIAIVVHYHYQWNKRDEGTRNRAALREHLAVAQAILQGRQTEAIALLAAHLSTARATLMASVTWD